MPKPNLSLILLIVLYVIFSIAAVWRAIDIGTIDVFTLGVVPVLIGMLIRAPWSNAVLKVYVALQALGFSALGVTAILAYQITPEDVRVVIAGEELPMLPLILSIIALLVFQFSVAFSSKTKRYLNQADEEIQDPVK